MAFDTIDERTIKALVDSFYGKIRQDPVIGPIFLREIADWGPHLKTMVDFWSSVMLTSGRYKGNPLAKHMVLAGLEPSSFSVWLGLFEETAGELFVPELAAQFVEKAGRIAESLKLGLFFRPGAIAKMAS